jgi:hypothetical protein
VSDQQGAGAGGFVVEGPDDSGGLRVTDGQGQLIGEFKPDDDGGEWEKYAKTLGLTKADFPVCPSCEWTHRRGPCPYDDPHAD